MMKTKTNHTRDEIIDTILSLIKTMYIPKNRKTSRSTPNMRWLYKNLHKYNQNHKNYQQVMELLDKILN